MEKFIVSARKYRPARFEDVVGQDHITETLKNAIKNNKVAQAYLFTGPRGVGKTTCARILAKTINCEHISSDYEACGECPSCISFRESTSFNIHELDAASNNSVEGIRSLTEQVRYAPQSGKYKIYIIDEVHMLSQAAFNAFLKTLEEPPPYAVFILATTEKHKILPTILSRCQIFDFNRIGISDIVEHLGQISEKEKINAEKDALHLIAQKADGALRDALSIFDRLISFSNDNLTYDMVLKSLNILDYDYFFKLTDCLLAEDRTCVMLIFDEILQNGFEGDVLLQGLSQHFRDLLMCKDIQTVHLLEISDNLKEKYKIQSEYAPTGFLLSGLNIIGQGLQHYAFSKNKRILVELALIKICHLKQQIEPGTTVSSESKKNTETVKKEKQEPLPQKNPSETPEPVVQKQEPSLKEQEGNYKTVEKKEEKGKPLDIAGEIKKRRSSSLIKDVHKPQVTGHTKDSGEEKQVDIGPEISQEQLNEAWQGMLDNFKQAGDEAILSITKPLEPKVSSGNNLTISLNNKLQWNILKKEQIKIADQLNEQLKPSRVVISVIFDEASKVNLADNRPFTVQDKYKKMIEKNPLVKDLEQQLDLDLEY
jgi:DNA polymerase III subunit gamma/tau